MNGAGNDRDALNAAVDLERHERHELSFEDFDMRVSVESDGGVWVSFHENGKCVFTISTLDLRDVVAFVERHADVGLVERD